MRIFAQLRRNGFAFRDTACTVRPEGRGVLATVVAQDWDTVWLEALLVLSLVGKHDF